MNRTDYLEIGKSYLFSFNSDGIAKPSESDVLARINSLSFISNIHVEFVGGLLGLFGSGLNVRFQSTSNQWTVEQALQNLEGSLDNGIGNFTFTSATQIDDVNPNQNPSVTKIVLYGGLALVALIFIYSFANGLGQGVLKRK